MWKPATEKKGEQRPQETASLHAKFVGWIIHELNNRLGAVLPTLELMKGSLLEPRMVMRSVERALTSARDAGVLSKFLLLLNAKPKTADKFDARDALARAVEWFEETLDSRVPLETRLEPGSFHLEGNAVELEKVFAILLMTAYRTMRIGGRLLVTAHKSGSKTLQMEISDGPEHSAEGYAPVFPAADPVHGPEFGITLAARILANYGGILRRGKGPADFQIELRAMAPSLKRIEGVTESILLVDDDHLIGILFKEALESLGYTVHVCGSGQGALDLVERHHVDLVVADVYMPEICGVELFKRLAELRPDLQTIFISGYPESEVARKGLSASYAAFVQKPISPDKLHKVMRRVLDKKEAEWKR